MKGPGSHELPSSASQAAIGHPVRPFELCCNLCVSQFLQSVVYTQLHEPLGVYALALLVPA